MSKKHVSILLNGATEDDLKEALLNNKITLEEYANYFQYQIKDVEFWKSLISTGKLNLQQYAQYAYIPNKQTTNRKVGYLSYTNSLCFFGRKDLTTWLKRERKNGVVFGEESTVFLMEHINYIDSRSQNLYITILDRHDLIIYLKDALDWKEIASYPNLSMTLVNKYEDYLDVKNLIQYNKNITSRDMMRLLDRVEEPIKFSSLYESVKAQRIIPKDVLSSGKFDFEDYLSNNLNKNIIRIYGGVSQYSNSILNDLGFKTKVDFVLAIESEPSSDLLKYVEEHAEDILNRDIPPKKAKQEIKNIQTNNVLNFEDLLNRAKECKPKERVKVSIKLPYNIAKAPDFINHIREYIVNNS